jgi:hypothetical protein
MYKAGSGNGIRLVVYDLVTLTGSEDGNLRSVSFKGLKFVNNSLPVTAHGQTHRSFCIWHDRGVFH